MRPDQTAPSPGTASALEAAVGLEVSCIEVELARLRRLAVGTDMPVVARARILVQLADMAGQLQGLVTFAERQQ